jgi:EAL domain-containing protein (putative c-di-GMP-specific phosphodiesterase class I)
MRRRPAHRAEQGALPGALASSAELLERTELHLRAADGAPRMLAVLCITLCVPMAEAGVAAAELSASLFKAVATRLRGVLQAKDQFARSGGCELLVVLPELTSPGFAHLAAQAIANALGAPVEADGSLHSLLVATGVALAPLHARGPEALFACARSAARDCARRGALAGGSQRLGFLVYDGDPVPDRSGFLLTGSELQAAIDDNCLCLHFQPQLDLRSDRVLSVEALLRWERHPGEWISPEQILACAERANLVGVLTQWTVNTALRQTRDWQRGGLPGIEVGVNLPPAALEQPDLPQLIALALETFGVGPGQLTLEITESAAIGDAGCSLRTLTALRALGVRISVDDFGTGYNTYQWLRDMPLDEVKIEKLFIRDLGRSPRNAIIVDSVIRLAHALGVSVVAEGVEDQTARDALVAMGCDRILGYGFSRPVAAEVCTDFLRARRPARA